MMRFARVAVTFVADGIRRVLKRLGAPGSGPFAAGC